MNIVSTNPAGLQDLGWLANVPEKAWPLSDRDPIFVERFHTGSGLVALSPQRHPFCKISLLLSGRGVEYCGGEKAEIRAGDIVLFGPQVSHMHRVKEFPVSSVSVHFLPSAFISIGTDSDGLRMLHRFTAQQPLSRRVIRASPSLRRKMTRHMDQMFEESQSTTFGSRWRLRGLFYQSIVDLLRWEQRQGAPEPHEEPNRSHRDLRPLDAVLGYIRDHFDQPIYSSELANTANINEAALNALFREVLKMTWVQYLQGYRVQRSAALLITGSHNVTQAAMACGFESLSHFNSMFRRVMGVSPKQFAKRHPPVLPAAT